MPVTPARSSIRIAVLVSGHGRGTNLRALIDGCVSGEISGQVALVVGTRADAPAMQLAAACGARALVLAPRRYENNETGYAEALETALTEETIDLICLAGYMRKLPSVTVARYAYRIMNVHAALLPLFGGKGMYGAHVHEAVIASGMKVSGCTVHFVDEQYDTGPIIVQTAVEVREEDTPETLAARVLPAEHAAYVRAVRLFAEGRLEVEGRRVRVLQREPVPGKSTT